MRASGAKCEVRLQSSTVIFCNDPKSNNITSYVALINDTSKLYGASERLGISTVGGEGSRGVQ
jgi:hypothetical protein